MLVLVLGWTQCLPQGVGAPPAMRRGRTAGPPGRRGRWIQFAQCSPDSPPDCGTNHEHGVSVWFNSEIGSALDLNFERLGFDPHCG